MPLGGATIQTLRYWDYYGMTDCFTELFESSKQGKTHKNLYELIVSRKNILLAYRMIKSNKGSNTAGTDGKSIKYLKTLEDSQIVDLVRAKLKMYQPKLVRRVNIPKANGKMRPLGIPCILDRLIQQCFKQILEPIAEAKFHNHSYGFRPLRSTHHALARIQSLVNHSKLHFMVDIDIKGFFDNINHRTLIKQMWNLGIKDRRVLTLVQKMLKAPIQGEGVPYKGTPQGGVLSPLLSNIVLNDLDQWVSGQWEQFEPRRNYTYLNKYRALKKTGLKEGYIVRYADDFKILCRDLKTAKKWFYAVKEYLSVRLGLEISPEKSKIVNLRKKKSEFLGFTIKVVKKRQTYVANTGIIDKKKADIKLKAKKYIRNIVNNPVARNVQLYNSFVLGIHNYFKIATHVNIEFKRLAYDLRTFIYNRMKKVGKYMYPNKAPPSYTTFYSKSYRTFRVATIFLFPIPDIKTLYTPNFTQTNTIFSVEGRKKIYSKMDMAVEKEIAKLLRSTLPNRSIEYFDNRISRSSMVKGKCEISGYMLPALLVHCHHHKPLHLGGDDSFRNLRILHKDVHRLVHTTNDNTIRKLIKELDLNKTHIRKVNKFRLMSNLELINI
ncbi:group II intron reverse transcriptase/maturase [Siminovitchia terrae]|uniref:group II intron reverse transcriptase/maturase n=1 Tax=Siminovitchia terrae TaxID=1914933 RepID=UPI0028A9E71B|nr:group II intron reverse transcriptase/maturase [Siminovitchia terrae]